MITRITYAICLVIMCCASFVFYPRWKQEKTNAAIAWDVSGYYWYLPSIFIYHDLKHQSFKDSILEKYEPTGRDFQQGFLHSSGNYVMKYSSGMAVMFAPFFFVAHALAEPLGYPADGFSAPYQLAIQLGGLLVALAGLWYFRKLLLLYYSEKVTAICMLLLVLGSNFLNYGAIDTGMSHSWLFTVYVLLMLATYYFYKEPSYKYALLIGLLCGIASLTRPTDIISVLIPLLWGMEGLSLRAIRAQVATYSKNYRYLAVAITAFMAVVSIQLVYWKYAAGEWIVYSYQEQGFTWLKPHVIGYLISPHNGWLAYTPLMAFAFIGLPVFWKYGKNKVALTLFFFINLYIVICWEFYWHGGRFMVQSYPVLFFPIASMMQYISRKKLLAWVFGPLIILFVYINIWTTYHSHAGPGLLDFDTITPSYYFKVAGTWSKPSDATIKLKDNEAVYPGTDESLTVIYSQDFETDTVNTNCSFPPLDGRRSGCINREHPSINTFLPASPAMKQWLRASALFRCIDDEWNVWGMTQLIVEFQQDGKSVSSSMIRLHRLLDEGEQKTIWIDAPVPDTPFDRVMIAVWNLGTDRRLQMDNLKVYSVKGL